MTQDEMREALAEALCVIYGDAIDEARPAASALLPVVQRIAAEEYRRGYVNADNGLDPTPAR